MSWKERVTMSFALAMQALVLLMVVGETVVAILTRDWSRLIFPFFSMWLLINIFLIEMKMLKEKRIFVVLKDKDW